MKIKKLFLYKGKFQIWRILITESNKLIVETRDIEKKEAFFNCLDIESGKKFFTDYQFEEKFWIGIEDIYKDIIFLHKFAKPDLPGHKHIIAFDINSQQILWENPDYSFLFILNDKIYAYRQKFENRSYYALDILTGNVVKDCGTDFREINKLNEIAANKKDFSQYVFPVPFNSPGIDNFEINEIIAEEIKNLEIVGDVEYNKFNNFLLMNYHQKKSGTFLENIFKIYDLKTNREVLNETLNSNANAFVPDSFFVYKNMLVLLIEKTGLKVYKLN